jgi:cytoplasmic iron level regulating protein YaaA (DUF328/UPF0246 family)
MLIVLSPAKRLDWAPRPERMTEPAHADEAARLIRTLRNRSLAEIRGLMDLSDDLARLNRDRYRAYSDAPPKEALRPAVFAFAGDTYQGLDAASLSATDIEEAQRRLRILSGLYGVLRPLDAIQPYRLEMGTRLSTRRGGDLYAFWGTRLAEDLTAAGRAAGTGILLNCASQEYFRAVPARSLGLHIVTPRFLEPGPNGPRVVGIRAKRARGAMARWVIRHRVEASEELAGFDEDGYRFDAANSEPGAPAFLRQPSG